jgi:hypothetical protein
MPGTPLRRGILALDIEGFGQPDRTDPQRAQLRTRLHALLDHALAAAQIRPAEVAARSDLGDAVLVLFDPGVSAATLLHPLLSELAARLARGNRSVTGAARLRLRAVVHEGQVLADAHGYVGEDLNHAFRLLNAPATRAVLADNPGADAVLVVSDAVFQGIVRHRYQGLDPSGWQPVRVHAKETRTRAWVHLPGLARQPDLSALPAAAPAGPAAVPVRGTALLRAMASAVSFRMASRAHPAGPDPAALRDRAARDLATWVERQWRQEATARLLDRPEPLQVRWSWTARPAAPPPGEVLGAAAATGQVRRLPLRGDLGDVVDRFVQLPQRQLVVLGRPGAGKSVLVLLLTLGLLGRWRPGEPVPVLLNVSSWKPNREHLDSWLGRRLLEEYPVLGNQRLYGVDVAMRLVAAGGVLPVLDGLDELPQTQHPTAVAGLNHAVGGGRPLVVACRAEEYQAAVAATGTTLGRAAVVELEPVDVVAAAAYLQGGQVHGNRRWAPVVAHLGANPRGPLAQALSTPLMVYLARTVYTAPERDPTELCDPRRWAEPGQIEDHLLDAYLPAIYARGSLLPVADGQSPPTVRIYPADRAQQWLTFLAVRMGALGTRDIAWWHLPRMIPRFRLVFGLTVRITAGLAFGLAFGLTYGFTYGLDRGLTYGVVYGLSLGLGLSVGLGLRAVLAAGLAAGLTAGLTAGLGIGLRLGLDYGLRAALEAGFIAGLGVALITRRDNSVDSRPRQVQLSAGRLLRATGRCLPIGLIAGLVLGLVFAATLEPATAFALGLAYGLPFMLGFSVSEAIVMPVDDHDQDSASPMSLLRGERAATVAQVVAFGLAATVADILSTALAGDFKGDLVLRLAAGLMFGAAFGLAAGLATGVGSPWLRFVSVQGWFTMRGGLPWRLMAFLDDAYRRGVLRQVGAVYQFRHARLQDRLRGGDGIDDEPPVDTVAAERQRAGSP